MPSKSRAQAGLIAGAIHNPELRKRLGMSMEKLKEWRREDVKRGVSRLPERKSSK